MTPRVSIVILSHRPQMFPQAVASACAQTVPCEIISTHAPDGYPEKMNAAVSIARGTWVLPLCDDDALHPRYVERCLFFSKDADVVFTDRRVWWERWEWKNPASWVHRTPHTGKACTLFPEIAALAHQQGGAAQITLPRESFAFGSALPMTCLIRRSLWNDLGGYDNITHADTDLMYRAVRAGARMVYVPEPLFLYRFHGDNLSLQRPSNGRAALDFHAKHFQDFGFAFTPHPTKADEFECTVIPEAERAEYARRHGMRVA